MAGRPKTMLTRAEQLEVVAFKVADALLQRMPRQYDEEIAPDDCLGEAWRDAYRATMHSWLMLADLADLLRRKAGLQGDGPTAQLRLIRRSRNENGDVNWDTPAEPPNDRGRTTKGPGGSSSNQ